MSGFYGFELVARVGVLPPIHGSIEAWRALDGSKDITLVRSRPDIIDAELRGADSIVTHFLDDLESVNMRTPEPGQLKLLEIRRVENGRIPLGVFEPVAGWVLRDVAATLRLDVPVAAALAWQLFRTYAGAANVVRPDGKLARCMLPHFEKVWEDETPSFAGFEPDVSVTGRVKEARELLERICGRTTRGHYDNAADFESEMKELCAGVDLGAELVKALR